MFVTGYPNSVTNVIEVAKLYDAIGFFEKTAFDVEDEVKLSKAGRQGLSWASVGLTYTPSNTGDAQVTLKGRLKGRFTTDIITGSRVDNWVTAKLHVVEKDSYIPEENEGESCELYYYNFTSNKKTIDVTLDKGFVVSLSEGTEYLIYLKLKTLERD